MRQKRRPCHGVVGATGVVAALVGFAGGFYAPSTAISAALAIWILRATLVSLFTDRVSVKTPPDQQHEHRCASR